MYVNYKDGHITDVLFVHISARRIYLKLEAHLFLLSCPFQWQSNAIQIL
jgi:hypothetical protein